MSDDTKKLLIFFGILGSLFILLYVSSKTQIGQVIEFLETLP